MWWEMMPPTTEARFGFFSRTSTTDQASPMPREVSVSEREETQRPNPQFHPAS
eukprot:m.484207 g.484207  ORF g.484207 m.484207 type:complete len:53 (-) comp68071_c0_seq1:308-466(-)